MNVSVNEDVDEVAEQVVALLRDRGWTIATGESITAGLVAASLAQAPGCSHVLSGGVVSYQVDVKESVLGVPAQALAHGVVSEQVAMALAQGAAATLGARIGVGTTGAAGPDPHDGAAPGTAWVAVWMHGGPDQSPVARSRLVNASGDRARVRREVTDAALQEVRALLSA